MPTPVYDVTTFTSPSGTSPFTDIGTVINEIMSDIRTTQNDASFPASQHKRPGAVIYIPPGHYDLLTTAVIDRSYIQIKGSGHGFMSQAIRDDEGLSTGTWLELEPGASHIRNKVTTGSKEAFRVERSGDPAAIGRLNGIEFRDFCINGVTASRPYLPGNGKVGISVISDNDSLRIEGMGMMYLAHAIRLHGADAASVINNVICECGSGVELLGGAIVPKIQDNFIICPWAGNSIYIENCQGFLISGNSMLWHGAVTLANCERGSITGNRLNSEWPGQIVFDNDCKQILVASNHIYREGLYHLDSASSHDDLFGMLHIRGRDHTITANHIGFGVPTSQPADPAGAAPTFILVAQGSGDIISNNHIVSTKAGKVVLDGSTSGTKLLWSTVAGQLLAYSGASYNEVTIP